MCERGIGCVLIYRLPATGYGWIVLRRGGMFVVAELEKCDGWEESQRGERRKGRCFVCGSNRTHGPYGIRLDGVGFSARKSELLGPCEGMKS